MQPARQQPLFRDRPGVFAETGLTVLLLRGRDVWSFLQNQTTQEVLSLQDGDHVWAAAVDRHGKVQGLFTVHRKGDDAWLVMQSEAVAGLIAHFSKFRILEDVQFEDWAEKGAFIGVAGPGSEKCLQACIASLPTLARSFTGDPGWLMWVPGEQHAGVLSALTDSVTYQGGYLAETGLLARLQLEAGLPSWQTELSLGLLLPETGLADRCVSYTKGCYLGQEVIAKMKTYGGTPRLLMGLIPERPLTPEEAAALAEALTPLPLTISESGKPAGVLTRLLPTPEGTHWQGMALLNRDARQTGLVLSVTLPGSETQIRFNVQPFPLYKVTTDAAETTDDPEAARKNLTAGLAAFASGDDADAIHLLETATTQDATLTDAFEALGAILSRQNRVDDAIAAMEKVLMLDADHVMAHTNLSILWLKKGDKDKAEDEKAKALVARMRQSAKASGVDFARLEAERQEKEDAKRAQMEERITLFQSALSHSPDDPLGNFGLGSALLELGRFSEAVAPFEKTIAAQPKHSVAYLSLGKALEGAKQPGPARDAYTRGVAVAAARGDLMPMQEMEQRLSRL